MMPTIVLLAVLALSAASTVVTAQVKETASPTSAPTDLFSHVYTLPDERAFECPHYVYRNYFMGKCADGSNPRLAGTLRLSTKTLQQRWRQVCGQRCLERNVFNRDAANRCVGYVRAATDACQLFQCPSGNATVVDMRRPPKPKRRGRNTVVPISVLMDESCFIPIPTSSPTTGSPTRAPTIARCDVTGTYRTEFASLNGAAAGLDRFTEILPSLNLCEFVRPTSFNVNNIKTVQNFTCSYESCLRWCHYDAGCMFALWSPVDQVCHKANNLEITDHETNFKPYWIAKYRAWRKSTIPIRYFSGKCNDLPPASCKNDAECSWNRGKMGYNDPLQGGGANGFCGRIKCMEARNWAGRPG